MKTTRALHCTLAASVLYGGLFLMLSSVRAGIVTNTLDSGAGSLRQAINEAGSGDTITFTNTLSGQTIVLTSGSLLVNKNITIDASALPGGIVLDGNGSDRIFTYAPGTINVLTRLTLTNGNTHHGGAISLDSSAVLTINDSTLSGNSVDGWGGAIYNNGGTLTLNNSTLSGNGAGWGGGILSKTANITYTPISSRTVLNQCTLVNNSATTEGGAVDNANGWTFMTNCTVVGNTSPYGAGVQSYGDGYTETVVANSIIAGNSGGSDLELSDTSNPHAFLSMGHNLVGNGFTGYFTSTGDATNHTAASIQLAPLDEYGGPTQTMSPLPGSPAIDTGGATTFATDQRGYPRLSGSAVDIGAVEFQDLVVLNNDDSGFGSLRQAIAEASPGITIIFTNTLSGQTILLTSGQLLVNRNLSIDASALPDGITVDGNGADRIFTFFGTTNVLTELTLTNGYSSYGGAIYMYNNTVLTINDSTLSGNAANGDLGGGICNDHGTLMLNNCTLCGNTSASIGGGVASYTDDITNTLITSSTTLNQCTLVNNSATTAGGAFGNANGWTFMTNCTITSNTSPDGAGVWTFGDSLTETVVANTIIAGNLGGSDLGLVTTTNPDGFLSMGYNLVGNGYTGYFTATGDATNHTASSIQLAPLGNYGGPTQTMSPLPGSPAIDAGGTPMFATDQRGMTRVLSAGLGPAVVDIGAVEYNGWLVGQDLSSLDPALLLPGSIYDSSTVFPIGFDPDSADMLAVLSSPEQDALISEGESNVIGDPAFYGLYTSNSIMDLSMGYLMLQTTPSNTVYLWLQLEQNTNLVDGIWTNAGDAVWWEDTAPDGKSFFRVHGNSP